MSGVLYGCETVSILRKERFLAVFQNGMPRKILNEGTPEEKKKQNGDLGILYFSHLFFGGGGVIERREVRWMRHVLRIREKRNANIILGGKREGKRASGRN